MSQQEKAAYYKALKAAGVVFEKHYRDYSTDELKVAHAKLEEAGIAPEVTIAEPQGDAAIAALVNAEVEKRLAALRADAPAPEQGVYSPAETVEQPSPPQAPRSNVADPAELPGQRLNTGTDEPIRIDDEGLAWFQEEVRKPAYPKPRGRRVLRYMDTGVEKQTVQAGDYVEEFEVAGKGAARPAEVKITLPSYQVGIYKDPRFPFKIHVYNENRGFDLFEVQNYYGGSEMVPPEVKRVYVENVLCYDIRTVVRAIQSEFRQLQLAGKVQ